MKIVWNRSLGWNIELNKMLKSTRTIPPAPSYNGAGQLNPNPGKNYMEYTIVANGANCYPWREVYAWWPVKTINGERVWAERLFKRRVWVVWGTGFHMEPETQYATVFDLIAHCDDNNI